MNTDPPRTGRPRKAANERRGKPFAFRVSEDERRAIEAAADAAGMRPSDYARHMTLTGRVIVHQHRTFADSDRADFGRVGSNLNQIAKHLNAGRAVAPDAIEAALVEWRDLAERLK